MKYRVNFGPTTDSEIFDSMDEIEAWLDQYIIDHMTGNENFEEVRKNFIENQIVEIDE